jgi:UDP-glucose 4-epimerase
MNVLVTGGAGFIGSVCAERLLSTGQRVVVVDNLSTGHQAAVPSGARFVQGDFADRAICADLIRRFKIETVMHFAAETLVEKSMTDPRAYFQNNLKKGINFLDVLVDSGVRNFVFSSTAAVYGEPQQTPIAEDHPTNPINAYGDSKLMFEKVLGWYGRAYGLRSIVLRYFNAAGATQLLGEDHCPESHLIPRLLNSVMDPSAEFVLYGKDYPTLDGTCIRDYVHVRDVAEAHVLAAEALAKGICGTFNIGSGTGFSVKEVISTTEQVLGRPIRLRVGPRREGDPAILVASNGKLSRELGWKPLSSSLQEIVKSAWEWKRTHSHGYMSHVNGQTQRVASQVQEDEIRLAAPPPFGS